MSALCMVGSRGSVVELNFVIHLVQLSVTQVEPNNRYNKHEFEVLYHYVSASIFDGEWKNMYFVGVAVLVPGSLIRGSSSNRQPPHK